MVHEVQERVKDIDTMDDDEIITAVIDAWAFVCEENEAQKSLVSSFHYDQWLSYRNSKSESMKKIVESYTGELGESDRNFFEFLARDIAKAQHKSKAELLEEVAKAKAEKDITTLQQGNQLTKDDTKKKSAWTKILNKFSMR